MSNEPEEQDKTASYLSNFKNMLAPENIHMTNMLKKYAPAIPFKKDIYLTADQLKSAVFESPRVQRIIDEFSVIAQQLSLYDPDPKKRKDVEKGVHAMIKEIALGHNLKYVRFLGMVINQILTRILENGLHVNETNLQLVKNQFGGQPVLYLPSHRSYADFILMSYVCFCYNIVIPGIAAGMDFHGMAGMGEVLRNTGAFFMRRSFANDMQYWYVFKEYMRTLMNLYHAGVEFFVEGTRSRSNKALTPKIGLLSMALEPLFMGEIPDVLIVPISVTYEKPLEEQLFVYELLGVPKPKESTLGLFKALSIVNKNFGEIYFEFGKPFTAKDYFGKELNRWSHAINPAHVQNLTKAELGLVTNLAYDVIRLQQEKIFITTFNLISIYYNYKKYLGQSVSLEEMLKGIEMMSTIFQDLGATLTLEKEKDVKAAVLKSLQIHDNILTLNNKNKIDIARTNCDFSNVDKTKLKGHNLSEDIMKLSVPIFSLQLYNNPCLQWLAQPALLVLSAKKLSGNGVTHISLDELKDEVHKLRNIFMHEFVFCQRREDIQFKKAFDHLIKYEIFQQFNNKLINFNSDNENINFYLSTIAPFICCYLQTASTICNFSDKSFSDKDIFAKTQENIEHLLLSYERNVHPYCLSLDSINLAILSFLNSKALSRRKIDKLYIYTTDQNIMTDLKTTLEVYCNMLPFNYLTFQSTVTPAKL